MKVYLISKKSGANAVGEYSLQDGSVTVKKGSILSLTLSESKTFRGMKTIQKAREGVMEGNTLTVDVTFRSPSTAANFVMGGSSNGLRMWKTENGTPIGDLEKEG